MAMSFRVEERLEWSKDYLLMEPANMEGSTCTIIEEKGKESWIFLATRRMAEKGEDRLHIAHQDNTRPWVSAPLWGGTRDFSFRSLA